MVGKVGEKMEISRLAVIKAEGGVVVPYVHPGSKLASLVELSVDQKQDDVLTLAKDLAMQVAASAPIVKDRSEVPSENIEREREIFRQQAIGEGKPEKVIDRIVTGKIEKYYQDVVLLEQAFIKDGTKTVADILKETSNRLSSRIELKSFIRFQLGER
jgi:elongation factor Ts